MVGRVRLKVRRPSNLSRIRDSDAKKSYIASAFKIPHCSSVGFSEVVSGFDDIHLVWANVCEYLQDGGMIHDDLF